MKDLRKMWDGMGNLEREQRFEEAIVIAEGLCERLRGQVRQRGRLGMLLRGIVYLLRYEMLSGGAERAEQRLRAILGAKVVGLDGILGVLLGEMYERRIASFIVLGGTAADMFVEMEAAHAAYWQAAADEGAKRITERELGETLFEGMDWGARRLSLFEIVINRGLEFFISERRHWERGPLGMVMEAEALGASDIFLGWSIDVSGAGLMSGHWALVLWQRLLGHYLAVGELEAFNLADIRRLGYAWERSSLANRDELYEGALLGIWERCKNGLDGAEAAYKLGEHYIWRSKAGGACREAGLGYLRWVEASHGKSDSAKAAAALRCIAERRFYDIDIEEASAEGADIVVRVRYQNIKCLYYRVLLITRILGENLRHREGEALLRHLVHYKAKASGVWRLEDFGDSVEHSAEMYLGGLERGAYILLVSHNEDFKVKTGNAMCCLFFDVTDLAYWGRQVNGVHDFFIVNRQTGAPLEGVRGQFLLEMLNRKSGAIWWDKGRRQYSDRMGWLKPMVADTRTDTHTGQFRLDLAMAAERTRVTHNFFDIPRGAQEVSERRVEAYFLLDSVVYFPGSLVRFKVVLIEVALMGQWLGVLRQQESVISLRSINGSCVGSLAVKTNDYGSYEGFFALSEDCTHGPFELVDEHSQTRKSFLVEVFDYSESVMRMDFAGGPYKLGDKVALSGYIAERALGGMEGTRIAYRVDCPRKSEETGSDVSENIASGEVYSDDFGRFSFAFEATASGESGLILFVVYADAYGQDGKIHSSQCSIALSPFDSKLEADLPEYLACHDQTPIAIAIRQQNGQLRAAPLCISIERLLPPAPINTPKLWPTANNNSTPMQSAGIIYSDRREADAKHTLHLAEALASAPKGSYVLHLQSWDSSGQEIKIAHNFVFYEPEASQCPAPLPIFCVLERPTAYVGQAARLTIGSANPDAFILLQIERNSQIISQQWLQPNGCTTIEIPLTSADTGGLYFHLASAQNGRFYTQKLFLTVLVQRPSLQIHLQDFSHSLPADTETTLTICTTDQDGNPMPAEISAALYNAEIDHVYPLQWQPPQPKLPQSTLSVVPASGFSLAKKQNFKQDFSHHPDGGGSRPLPKLFWLDMPFSKIFPYALTEETAPDQQPIPYHRTIIHASPNATCNPEAAIFVANITTDQTGKAFFHFKTPHHLQKWKLLLFAHNPHTQPAAISKILHTTTDFDILFDTPHQLIAGQTQHITVLIDSTARSFQRGHIQIQLFDKASHASLDYLSTSPLTPIPFCVAEHRYQRFCWSLCIPPHLVGTIALRATAHTGHSQRIKTTTIPVHHLPSLINKYPIDAAQNYLTQLLDNSPKFPDLDIFSLTAQSLIHLLKYPILPSPKHSAISRLVAVQLPTGPFSVRPSSQADWFVTQTVLFRLALLLRLIPDLPDGINYAISRAVAYVDNKVYLLYEKYQIDKVPLDIPLIVLYLATRCKYKQLFVPEDAIKFFFKFISKRWRQYSPFIQTIYAIAALEYKPRLAQYIISHLLKSTQYPASLFHSYHKPINQLSHIAILLSLARSKRKTIAPIIYQLVSFYNQQPSICDLEAADFALALAFNPKISTMTPRPSPDLPATPRHLPISITKTISAQPSRDLPSDSIFAKIQIDIQATADAHCLLLTEPFPLGLHPISGTLRHNLPPAIKSPQLGLYAIRLFFHSIPAGRYFISYRCRVPFNSPKSCPLCTITSRFADYQTAQTSTTWLSN